METWLLSRYAFGPLAIRHLPAPWTHPSAVMAATAYHAPPAAAFGASERETLQIVSSAGEYDGVRPKNVTRWTQVGTR